MVKKEDCEHEWEELSDLYAITRVNIDGETVSFMPSVGIPVIVKICKKCGKLEFFSAKMKGRA